MLTKPLTGRRFSGLRSPTDIIDDAGHDVFEFREHRNDGIAAKGLPSHKGAGKVRSQFLFSSSAEGLLQAGHPAPFGAGKRELIGRLSYYAVVVWNDCDTPKLRHDVGKRLF